MEYRLHTPLAQEEILRLRAGDRVLLTGTVYTARDAAHQRLIACLDQGAPLPFPLSDSVIYYAGPTPEAPDQVIGSAGPTTSGRMDSYTPRLLEQGLRVMIGKGDRSPTVRESIRRWGAVYLAAPGGAGALLAACVENVRLICWEDLGCEAIRELQVRDMPLLVAIDSEGQDLYTEGPAAYLSHRDEK